MKKKVLSFMMCFCLMAGVMSGCGANSEGVSGSVEQIEEDSKSIEADMESEAEPQPEEISYYMSKETKYEPCRFSSDGFHIKSEYEYDMNGNMVKETTYWEDGSTGSIEHTSATTEYAYDESGRVITAGGRQYEYDESGNLLSVKGKSPDGSQITEYEYDETGKLLSESRDGFISASYEYNDEGQLILINAGNQTQYEYDEAGNLIKETYSNADEPLYKKYGGIIYVYEYDTAGNIIRETLNDMSLTSEGRGSIIIEREYDDAGNLISVNRYESENGNVQLTYGSVYEYDENNRWIKEINTSYVTYEGPRDEPYIYEIVCRYEEEYDEAGNLIKISTYVDDFLDNYIEYEYTAQ